MSNDKYIGLDVHQSSVVTAVHNHQGKCVMESIIETKAQNIQDFIKSISSTVHIVFEEGTSGMALLIRLQKCTTIPQRRDIPQILALAPIIVLSIQ